MALREKFGKLVLLEKLGEDALGATFRAARVKSAPSQTNASPPQTVPSVP